MRAFFSPHAYSVFVSADGMRIGTSGRWIMWSDIRSVRENALFGRIDLIDYENHRLGSIQHRIEEFHSLLRIVRTGMRRYAMTRPPRRHFGSRARATALLAVSVALVCGLFVYVYVTDADHPWWALPAIPLYLLVAYMKTRGEVRQLDILDDVMIVSTVWRSQRLSRDAILSVRTILYDNDLVQPRVVLRDQREVNVAPTGSDVMEVYRAVFDWFDEREAR